MNNSEQAPPQDDLRGIAIVSLVLGILTHCLALCVAIALYVLPVSKMLASVSPEKNTSTTKTLTTSSTAPVPVPAVPQEPVIHRNPDFRAKPNAKRLFLHDDYQAGHKVFEVKGKDPEFLGTDANREILIVNKDNTLLEGISAADGTTRYSVPARSCSEVTDNMKLYCVGGDNLTTLLTIDAHTGDVVANTDSDLEFYSVEGAFSYNDIEILHVHAQQKNSKPADFVVALQNNQKIWQSNDTEALECGVLYEKAMFGCSAITQEGKSKRTNFYDIQNGELNLLFDPGASNSLLADGWLIHTGGSSYLIEYFKNHQKLTTSKPLIDQILPANSNLAGNNNTYLAYPIESYIQLADKEYIIVNSDGEIKFHNNLKDTRTFYRPNANEPAFTVEKSEEITTISQNGELVLKFKSDSKHLTLLDTTNKTVLFKIPRVKHLTKIVNGTLVVEPDGQDTNKDKVIRTYVPMRT